MPSQFPLVRGTTLGRYDVRQQPLVVRMAADDRAGHARMGA